MAGKAASSRSDVVSVMLSRVSCSVLIHCVGWIPLGTGLGIGGAGDIVSLLRWVGPAVTACDGFLLSGATYRTLFSSGHCLWSAWT